MKRSQLLIVMFLFALSTMASALPRKMVTLDMKNVTMGAFLQEIKKQTDVNFLYNSQIIKGEFVTVKAKNEPWESVLKRVLEANDLTYEVKNDVVVIRRVSRHNINVSGIVISDEDNQPIIGASVRVKGSKKVAITNSDGRFVIGNIPQGSVLTFSYIGMQGVEALARPSMQITMRSDAKELKEVVVTGYQVLNKRSLTSAVTTVNAEDILRTDMSSIDQMLEGRIPDLISTHNSGEIGVVPKIRIRGTSTLIGNREPLWVVDGIVVTDPVAISPQELNDPDYLNRIGNAIAGLNPQDIQRIDVLKDAAATAIYGTKAANGVIVITTKRGFVGKPQVKYNMAVTYRRRPRYSDRSVDVMSSKERIQFSRELAADHYQYADDINMIGYEGLLSQLYNNKINYNTFNSDVAKLEGLNTDWFKILSRDSFSTQHTVSLSGGSNATRYYASIGYDRENDVIKANNSDRYTAAINLDNTLSKWLMASFSFNGYVNKRNYYQSQIAPIQYAYTTSRALPAYTDDGEYFYYRLKPYSSSSFKYNILNDLDNSSYNQETSSFTVNANFRLTFTPWLRANAIFSYTNQNADIDGYWGERTSYAAYYRGAEYGEKITSPAYCLMPQGGELSKNNTRNKSWTGRLQVDMNKYFGENDKHNIDLTIGYEMNSVKYKGYSNITRGYYPDRGESFVKNINLATYTGYATWLAANVPTITDNLTNEISTYASLTYAYKNLYRLNINGRVDGSNKFGDRSNEKFLPIWSASGSYNLADCGLFKAKWVDFITIKASYGHQGNMLSSQSPNMTIRKQSMDSYYNEFTASVVSHPNPNLKWETTHSYNLGLDMSLLNHKVEFEGSLFYKTVKNAFMTKDVSTINGLSLYIINGGNITNKGYSFDLTVSPIMNKDFRWSLSSSFTKVINSINSHPNSQTYSLNKFLTGDVLVKGKPVNTFYSYKFLGLSPVNGGPLFDDYFDSQYALHGLSKYDTYTKVLEASGKRDPDISGSLTSTIRYKQWHMSANFYYSLGAKTRLFAMYGSAASDGAYDYTIRPDKNYSRDYMKRWKQPGDERHTNIPAIIGYNSSAYSTYINHWSSSWTSILTTKVQTFANNYWDMYDYSNIRVVSADYLKCTSLSFTYEFDSKLLIHLNLQRLALTVSGYNLFTICSPQLKGQTPTQGGFTTIQLSDRPSFSFGLNVIF
jgi:TonB-linked SusC/RagA family outer membrane protein